MLSIIKKIFSGEKRLGSAECSKEIRVYSLSEAEDTLKSMVGIRPKVIQDFAAIGDKFPCNTQALRCLQSFVNNF